MDALQTAVVGKNADPTLTLESLLVRSEAVTVGIDGGGLDDLLGLGIIGRERNSVTDAERAQDLTPTDVVGAPDGAPFRPGQGRWLHWGRAWAGEDVLERRKEIAPRLLDFERDGDLGIIKKSSAGFVDMTIAFAELADIVAKVFASGLTPEKAAIGVDPIGIGLILEALSARGIDTTREAGIVLGIEQGYRLQNAIKTVEVKLGAGKLIHGGRRFMAWAVGNAKIEPRGNAILITKQVSGFAKIDPLMALIDAAALMAMNPQVAGKGIFDFYARAAAATNKPQAAVAAAKVRLRAPAGISDVHTLTGKHHRVGVDRMIEVDQEDAAPLERQGFENLSTT